MFLEYEEKILALYEEKILAFMLQKYTKTWEGKKRQRGYNLHEWQGYTYLLNAHIEEKIDSMHTVEWITNRKKKA